MDQSTLIIQEQIKQLPRELKVYLAQGDWKENIKKIGADFNLDDEKITSIQFETMLVLIGLENSVLLAENIQHNAQITQEQAESLSQKIQEIILAHINQFLLPSQEKGDDIQQHEAGDVMKPFIAENSTTIQTEIVLDKEINNTEAGLAFLDSKLNSEKIPSNTESFSKEQQIENVIFSSSTPSPSYTRENDPYRESTQ